MALSATASSQAGHPAATCSPFTYFCKFPNLKLNDDSFPFELVLPDSPNLLPFCPNPTTTDSSPPFLKLLLLLLWLDLFFFAPLHSPDPTRIPRLESARPSGLKQLAYRLLGAHATHLRCCPHTHYNHHNHHHGDPDSIPGQLVKFLKFRKSCLRKWRKRKKKKKLEVEDKKPFKEWKVVKQNEAFFIYIYTYIYGLSLSFKSFPQFL